jgi:glycosyltransferase involved in cell wall biosynthesis
MRIAIVADPIDEQYAGVFYYTKQLIDALLRIDEKNEYFFIHLRKNKYFMGKNEVIIPGSRKIPGWMTLRKFLFISFAILRIKPDVVLEPAHIGPFSLLHKCKKIVVIHDLTPILFPQYHLKFSRIIHKILLPIILKNADGIIVPSLCTKHDLEKMYNPSKPIKVTYEAASQEFVPSDEKRIQQVKEKYNISGSYIIAVGTIEPRKNLTMLFEAFSEIRKADIDLKLVIIGKSGWFFKKIVAKMHGSKEVVIFTGYVERNELPILYSGAEFMVFPSIYEGFGLPPLEAMKCGCPVICSNSSSLPEVCGQAAILFDPAKPEELQKAMLEIITKPDLKKFMKNEGLIQATKFSWERCAEETIEFFMDIFFEKEYSINSTPASSVNT